MTQTKSVSKNFLINVVFYYFSASVTGSCVKKMPSDQEGNVDSQAPYVTVLGA